MSSPVAHAGRFLVSRLALAGLEPTILWLGVQRANHLAIATRDTGLSNNGNAPNVPRVTLSTLSVKTTLYTQNTHPEAQILLHFALPQLTANVSVTWL